MPYPNPTPCYWAEPTGRHRRGLRRYVLAEHQGYTCAEGWHDALVWLDVITGDRNNGDNWPHDDPRWPTQCQRGCGYAFTEEDRWQLFTRRLFRRGDTGTEATWEDLPPGAMQDADWLHYPYCQGPDGASLMVKCPNWLDWHIDGPARKGDEEPRYHAWARTGTPPRITVNPSIAIGYMRDPKDPTGKRWIPAPNHYHGWLRDGVLTPG